MIELIRRVLLSLFSILGVVWGLVVILVTGLAYILCHFTKWVFTGKWDFYVMEGDILHMGIECFTTSLLRVFFMEDRASLFKWRKQKPHRGDIML